MNEASNADRAQHLEKLREALHAQAVVRVLAVRDQETGAKP